MSFNLTRKTDYALVALTQLARDWNTETEATSARILADAYDLPQALLMNTLKELHRAQLIESRRGSNGGYYLTRNPRDITLLQVIEALEGRVSLALCTDDGADEPSLCQIEEQCPISHPIQRFNHLLNDFLKTITLADLLIHPHPLPQHGVPV